ncbi:phosphatidate cytidylyltransferase [Boseongicola aestuarii]|uniref:Phosphatidate cytidylyltransferase n=1 Tax=Boseongicola aestuarii TaxID=1470561 RepID=A0A238J032_9RHOB|nr:phosphatidate cytidylyltransferase [Boseongicola aestuarii]SMX23996.1 Phosphatidate cytidylyltransferase [Boseongicola aestuarii]
MASQTTLDILLLSFGVFGLLIALTLLGEFLRARLPVGQTNPVVEAFMVRVHSWWGLTIVLSLAVLSGKAGVILLFGFVSFAALREFLTFTSKRQADHLSLVLAFFVILPLQYVFVAFDWIGLFTVLVPVYAFLLLPIISALRGDTNRFLIRVAETQWALMICVYCISHVPALLTYDMPDGSDRSILLIVFFAMVVQLGDLFEYYAGRTFGRRKIAPGLSPKTLTGLLAGVLGAAVVGAVLSWITPFGVAGAAAMAALASITGMFGSIVFAAIKSDKSVKDWSHLIPGQGGFLDQLDSVIFAAPVFYHVTHLVWG